MAQRTILNPNIAYAIGLIASDGHLQKDGRHIVLTSKDIEQIHNFAKALGLRNKICALGSGRNKDKPYYRIRFSDVKFYRFLNELGIFAGKSHTIKSVIISEDLFADFLRGLFDGDGSFYSYYDKRWKNSLVYQIAFYSASLDFITWLKITLNKNFSVKGFIRKGDGVWALRYVKGDTRKIYRQMYKDKNTLFLKRKYDKISKLINLPR